MRKIKWSYIRKYGIFVHKIYMNPIAMIEFAEINFIFFCMYVKKKY